MSLFQSFLGHAAGAAADIYGEKAKGQQREAEARLQEELLMKREATIQAMREAAGIRADERQTQSRTAERKQIFQESMENAPLKRQSLIEDFKAQKNAEYDPEIQGMATTAETTKAKAKAQADIDFYKENEADILKKQRDIARAGNIDNGAGLRGIQMEAARMSLDEKKDLDKTIKAYETTEDPKEKAKLRDSLILRGVIKPSSGEFDTEKVIEKKVDTNTGSETTTERTQRRPSGKTDPASKPPLSSLKEGKVTTFANGQKWTLKNGQQVQVN